MNKNDFKDWPVADSAAPDEAEPTWMAVPLDDETMAAAEEVSARTQTPIPLLIAGVARRFFLDVRDTGKRIEVVPIGAADGGASRH